MEKLKGKKNILVLIACILLVGCIAVGIGIAVNQKPAYDTVTDGDTQTGEYANRGQSAIKSAAGREISGDDDGGQLDIALFALRGFELKNLFAVDAFDAPSEISVNKLVQFSFCHLYYDALTDMPDTVGSALIFREADPKQISDKIKLLFNVTNIEIETSDLYNSGTKTFQMWEPNYRTPVYFTAESKKNGASYTISAKYYSDEEHRNYIGAASVTVETNGKNYYISKMKSE